MKVNVNKINIILYELDSFFVDIVIPLDYFKTRKLLKRQYILREYSEGK